jgi:hypothetical protein
MACPWTNETVMSETWREHGECRLQRHLEEYEILGPAAPDFHRPISAYLNELASLGCRLREVAEPGLDPAVAAEAESAAPESVSSRQRAILLSLGRGRRASVRSWAAYGR